MPRRARASSPPRRTRTPDWRPALVPRTRRVKRRPKDSPEELSARIERIERGLYDLYDELQYFIASGADHRDRLRDRLSWPDVGHITSLARALAEEDRFEEWAKFNRYEEAA